MGLKENELSLNTQIVMVANLVDSITSFRPHIKIQNMDYAIQKLKIEREKYPQELVDLLANILK